MALAASARNRLNGSGVDECRYGVGDFEGHPKIVEERRATRMDRIYSDRWMRGSHRDSFQSHRLLLL